MLWKSTYTCACIVHTYAFSVSIDIIRLVNEVEDVLDDRTYVTADDLERLVYTEQVHIIVVNEAR